MNYRLIGLTGTITVSLAVWIGILLLIRGCVSSGVAEVALESPEMGLESTQGVETTYTLDQWADAILQAEGNDNYGIVSIPCTNGAQCRKYCKNTVHNTLVKYRTTRCRPEQSDLDCLAARYAPVGASNDPDNLNVNWKRNVRYFLTHRE